ncbi:hypothetical protein BH11VER1_BH11VER1_17150 [soil metagenome]
MSPSVYLVAVPLGLIAVTSWLVKSESDSFAQAKRSVNIQDQSRRGTPVPPPAVVDPAAARMDHERYGWQDGENASANTLGSIAAMRPLGSRPSQPVDWMAAQALRASSAAMNKTEIPGYIESAVPEVVFETVTTEAGYHITADEATKLDMTGNNVIFNGHVMMTSPQFKLSADQLIVHLGSDKKTFKFIEANQSVRVELVGVPEEKRYRGQSQKAIYEPSKDSIVLTGWPKVQGQGQELIAAEEKTKITMFSKTGKMFTEGRAQTRVSKQLMAEESAKPVAGRR